MADAPAQGRSGLIERKFMPFMAFAIILAATIFCVWVAERLAIRRGRAPLPWMKAVVWLGPLPLLPLALPWKKNRV